MKQIRVIVMEPGSPPQERKINSTLSTLQKIVGGNIEGVRCPWDNRLLFYGHDEGKLIGLDMNFSLHEFEDVFCGPCILVGPADGEGNETDLSDEHVKVALEQLEQRRFK